MFLEEIKNFAREYTLESEGNHVPAEAAITPELEGLRMYDEPLIGVCSADHPYFLRCKRGEVVGPQHLLPEEWLPGTKSVISFFFPASEQVRRGNARDLSFPSPEWLHARVEGQAFLASFIKELRDCLLAEGFEAVVPSADSRFATGPTPFTSNWSERHVAHACGLGTFGLSKGLITEKGIAGRFCSLITKCVLPVTAWNYGEHEEYCNLCGVCARNCPAGAITLEQGKNHKICSSFLDQVREKTAPRYGCGKCQVKVPCEHRIPVQRKTSAV